MTYMSNYDEMEGGFYESETSNEGQCDFCGEEGPIIELPKHDYCEDCYSGLYDGLSDYSERMAERSQMGLCNF